MENLKIQHVIVLSALFVSLLGTLLLLEKINQQSELVTGAVINPVEAEEEQEETAIIISEEINQTEEGSS